MALCAVRTERDYHLQRFGLLRGRKSFRDASQRKLMGHQLGRVNYALLDQRERFARLFGSARVARDEAGLVEVKIVWMDDHLFFGRCGRELNDRGAFARGRDSGVDRLASSGAHDDYISHRPPSDFANLLDEIVAGHDYSVIGPEFPGADCPSFKEIGADNHARAHVPRELHVHHAHDAQPDYKDRLAPPEPRAAQRLDDASGRLDQYAIRIVDGVGQLQCIALIGRADQEVLGHPAGLQVGRAPGRALDICAAPARGALEAGRVMVHVDALAGFEVAHRGAGFLDDADGFVAEHKRSFAPDVPRHDIAGADSTRAGADQNIVGANLGTGAFFDPDIAEIVETGNLHDLIELCGPRAALSTLRAGARGKKSADCEISLIKFSAISESVKSAQSADSLRILYRRENSNDRLALCLNRSARPLPPTRSSKSEIRLCSSIARIFRSDGPFPAASSISARLSSMPRCARRARKPP